MLPCLITNNLTLTVYLIADKLRWDVQASQDVQVGPEWWRFCWRGPPTRPSALSVQEESKVTLHRSWYQLRKDDPTCEHTSREWTRWAATPWQTLTDASVFNVQRLVLLLHNFFVAKKIIFFTLFLVVLRNVFNISSCINDHCTSLFVKFTTEELSKSTLSKTFILFILLAMSVLNFVVFNPSISATDLYFTAKRYVLGCVYCSTNSHYQLSKSPSIDQNVS